MRIFIVASLLIVFSISESFSQSNFKQGYIITQAKDTVRGWVDFRSARQNAIKCFFTDSLNGKVIKYVPEEISGYGFVNSKQYVAREYTLRDTSEFFFFEFLLNGSVDLFYLNGYNLDYYLIEKDQKLYPLTNDIVSVRGGGTEKTRNSNKYKGVLIYLMQDAPSLSSKINTTKFNHSDLIEITKAYHEATCAPNTPCLIYAKKDERKDKAKWVLNFELSLDAISSSITSQTTADNNSNWQGFPQYQYLDNQLDFSHSKFLVSPTVGIRVNRNSNSSFYLGLSYFHSDFQDVQLDWLFIPIKYQLDFLANKKITPFVEVGLVPGVCLNSDFKGAQLEYQKADYSSGNKEPDYLGPYTYEPDNSDIETQTKVGFVSSVGVKRRINHNRYWLAGLRYLSANCSLMGSEGQDSFTTHLKLRNFSFYLAFGL